MSFDLVGVLVLVLELFALLMDHKRKLPRLNVYGILLFIFITD